MLAGCEGDPLNYIGCIISSTRTAHSTSHPSNYLLNCPPHTWSLRWTPAGHMSSGYIYSGTSSFSGPLLPWLPNTSPSDHNKCVWSTLWSSSLIDIDKRIHHETSWCYVWPPPPYGSRPSGWLLSCSHPLLSSALISFSKDSPNLS